MTADTIAALPTSADELTLPVVGMTCASCVNRIERSLNRADGVATASVNLATERNRALRPGADRPDRHRRSDRGRRLRGRARGRR